VKRLHAIIFACLLTAAARAAPAAGFACSGSVIDAAGAPVDGAEVRLYGVAGREGSFRQELLAASASGADGLFEMRVAPEALAPWKNAVVVAFADGRAVGWADWPLYEPADIAVDIVLAKPESVSGVVRDGAGKPVEGAKVRAILKIVENGAARTLAGFSPLEELSALTGADGRFRFEAIPPDATVALVVTRDGLATAAVGLAAGPRPFEISPGAGDVAVTLAADARIEGVVRGPRGAPVTGVTLAAVPADRSRRPWLTREAVSGETGAFSLSSLVPGEYTVKVASLPEGREGIAAAPFNVTAAEDGPAALTVTLEPLAALSVRIVDEVSGKPVPGARILVRRRDAEGAAGETRQIFADEAGVAAAELPAGDYLIGDVSAAGYSGRNLQRLVVLAGGADEEIQVELEPPETIRGVILDPDGNPVPGAWVEVGPGGFHPGLKTDAEGRFEAGWSAEAGGRGGAPFVVARAPERGLAVRAPVGDAAREVSVKLARGVDLCGRVVDCDGDPVPGATMTIFWQDDAFTPPSEPVIAAADEKGRWRFDTVADCAAYRVTAEANGYGVGSAAIDVYGKSGEEVRVDDIVLEPADKVLSGRTVDEQGNAFPDARVRLWAAGMPNLTARSDAEGRWRFEGLPAGHMDIIAMGRRGENVYSSRAMRVDVPDEDVKIVMRLYVAPGAPPTPARPASLVGAPLPDLSALAGDAAADFEGKPVLVCFFDFNQRSSRHTVGELARAADKLAAAGVSVFLVDESGAPRAEVSERVGGLGASFAVAALEGDAEKVHAEWRVEGLPWLILADREHIVKAEGFQIGELVDRLAEIARD